MAQALCGLPLIRDPNLLVGLDPPDDAGVYRLNDELALVQTVDFFTPIVDDPFAFGQIAAANALSDVYAMGGKPLCAMNIVCFPSKTMDLEVLRQILHGGLSKLQEAQVALAGGHSVSDPELKYGLAVTGVIHPKQVRTKAGARVNDRLVLTKPIGTGIVATAVKAGKAGAQIQSMVTDSMAALNKKAAEMMQPLDVHAATDVTGFGLLGHACEMLQSATVGFEFWAQEVPIFSQALEFARMGLMPGGLQRNRDFRKDLVDFAPTISTELKDLLFDPQTSGGLLIALPDKAARSLLNDLHRHGVPEACIIGEVVADHPGKIVVR